MNCTNCQPKLDERLSQQRTPLKTKFVGIVEQLEDALIPGAETTISGNSCSAILFSLRYVISASNR